MCDLYGFTSNDLALISKGLEQVLEVSFELHESLFRGGDYYYYRIGKPWKEEIILQRNAELEDELAEPDHSAYRILLHVCTKEIHRLRVIREKILSMREIGATLLRTENEIPKLQ